MGSSWDKSEVTKGSVETDPGASTYDKTKYLQNIDLIYCMASLACANFLMLAYELETPVWGLIFSNEIISFLVSFATMELIIRTTSEHALGDISRLRAAEIGVLGGYSAAVMLSLGYTAMEKLI